VDYDFSKLMTQSSGEGDSSTIQCIKDLKNVSLMSGKDTLKFFGYHVTVSE